MNSPEMATQSRPGTSGKRSSGRCMCILSDVRNCNAGSRQNPESQGQCLIASGGRPQRQAASQECSVQACIHQLVCQFLQTRQHRVQIHQHDKTQAGRRRQACGHCQHLQHGSSSFQAAPSACTSQLLVFTGWQFATWSSALDSPTIKVMSQTFGTRSMYTLPTGNPMCSF